MSSRPQRHFARGPSDSAKAMRERIHAESRTPRRTEPGRTRYRCAARTRFDPTISR